MSYQRPILAFVLVSLGLIPAFASDTAGSEIERGRYLVRMVGCNDCHTPQYGLKAGDVPEKDWLIGDGVGWKGPWGTTYPGNLRHRIAQMTEEEWITYARALRTRPPMPWFTLNAMNTADLKLMYRFIRSLGDSANKVPDALAPGIAPKTPFMDVNVVMPKTASRK